MMKIGFTGTRHQLTDIQVELLESTLTELYEEGSTLSHGMCAGADEIANRLAKEIGYSTIGRPGNVSQSNSMTVDVKYPVEPYLKRNREIVDSSQIIIAIPNSMKEKVRSGTWATIRYARTKGVRVIIIYPNGNTEG